MMRGVAAGTTFNNQRQAIIDGLTAATSQTLGWNNVIRDSQLGVSDVVRTSDAVVTITLPAASGYAITSSETIQPIIPAAALVLSNAALNTGSTFTIEPQAASASVTVGGTAAGAGEADIVSGGRTVTLTLTNDTWIASGTAFDAVRQNIIDGIIASTNEQDGWNDNVPHEIEVEDVVRTSDTVVTVTLDAIADYSITADESITASVPHEALVTQEDVDAPASNSIGIIATGVASALFSGTATESMTENQVVSGGRTIIITLTNDTWAAAGTGPIGSTADTQSIIDALVAQASPTNGWNNEVVSEIDIADVVRTSNTVCTITLDAIAAL